MTKKPQPPRVVCPRCGPLLGLPASVTLADHLEQVHGVEREGRNPAPVIDLAAYRAQRELDYEPAPVEESKQHARALSLRYAGLEPVQSVGPGACTDCKLDALERWQVGTHAFCWTCAQL